MVVLLMQGLYAIVMLVAAITSLFIIFHVVHYSYSKVSMAIMLGLFVVPVAILFMTSLVLFSNIDLTVIFSNF